MMRRICCVLAICLLASWVAWADPAPLDLSPLRSRDSFYYVDDTNTSWGYEQYVGKELDDGTYVELLCACRGNGERIEYFPEMQIWITLSDGSELVAQGATIVADGNTFDLTMARFSEEDESAAYFILTGDATAFMKSMSAARSVSAILRHSYGAVHLSLTREEIAPISLFMEDVLTSNLLDYAEADVEWCRNQTPIESYMNSGAELETAGGAETEAENGLREYTLEAGPFTVTLDAEKYNILIPGMSEDEPAVVQSGIRVGGFEQYMSLMDRALLMFDKDQRLRAPFEISIRIKDGKYQGVDLRTASEENTNELLDTLYMGFMINGAANKEIVRIGDVPYLVFDWADGSQKRYATVIGGDMIYIWAEREDGQVTEEDAAVLRDVVESIKYPD